jgi:hypothetical protein
MAAIVRHDSSCLSALDHADRTLLRRLRAAATSARPVPATTAQLTAVRRLEAARRGGRCTPDDPPGRTAVLAAAASRAAPPSATSTSRGLSWTSPTELALLAVIAASLGALVYGLRRDFGRPRVAERRRWWRRDRL